jgi:H+/Cl- antiporter ClcA
MWQDLVFMVGSSLSILFLAPTLRDASARVPLGTSLPSMIIGMVYGLTFSTLGMTFSALGAFAAGTMWSFIAVLRSPIDAATMTRRDGLRLFAADVRRWLDHRVRQPEPTGYY